MEAQTKKNWTTITKANLSAGQALALVRLTAKGMVFCVCSAAMVLRNKRSDRFFGAFAAPSAAAAKSGEFQSVELNFGGRITACLVMPVTLNGEPYDYKALAEEHSPGGTWAVARMERNPVGQGYVSYVQNLDSEMQPAGDGWLTMPLVFDQCARRSACQVPALAKCFNLTVEACRLIGGAPALPEVIEEATPPELANAIKAEEEFRQKLAEKQRQRQGNRRGHRGPRRIIPDDLKSKLPPEVWQQVEAAIR